MDNIKEKGYLARYSRHTPSCMCVDYVQLPESLTRLSSSGLMSLILEAHPAG